MSEETMSEPPKVERSPGTCVPWEEKRAELPAITGNEELIAQVWKDIDALGYTYIWQLLLSF